MNLVRAIFQVIFWMVAIIVGAVAAAVVIFILVSLLAPVFFDRQLVIDFVPLSAQSEVSLQVTAVPTENPADRDRRPDPTATPQPTPQATPVPGTVTLGAGKHTLGLDRTFSLTWDGNTRPFQYHQTDDCYVSLMFNRDNGWHTTSTESVQSDPAIRIGDIDVHCTGKRVDYVVIQVCEANVQCGRLRLYR